jgi:adenylate cyclase
LSGENVQRRLAAILAADVAGYSRLMGTDEEGTLLRLKALRREVIDPLIAEHRGRLVKLTGDGALVEFASAVDAVRCAVAIQEAVTERTRAGPADRGLSFRIGINVGDVMIDGDDLYGDGVNVAARLEALAEPGGVTISGSAYDQVAGRLTYPMEFLGEQQVKNIDRPVRVYRLPADRSGAASAPAEVAAVKPSIVVLPFTNMSGDPEQDFFADGLTEDIITELSRFRHLVVISRNSSFVYKRRAVNVREVARELAVQYVVEGSVRRAGSRVRVTVQLIDALNDRHIWAERYDRELQDIFAIQDELTTAIVATLPGRLEAAAHDRVKRKQTDNLAAYEYVLTGKLLHHRSQSEANAEAQRMIDRAIALDPKYAHAHAWRACILGQAWVYGWCEDRDATFAEVSRELEIALSLDENDSDVHRILAAVCLTHRDHDRAFYHQERALSLNPNDDLIVVQQGEILTWLGRAEEGIEWIKKAMRLNPYHPERFWSHLGRAYFVTRRYAEAVEAFKRLSAPDHSQHAFLACCYAALGEQALAAAHKAEVLKRAPDFSIGSYLATLHYKQESDREHHRAVLDQAGFAA